MEWGEDEASRFELRKREFQAAEYDQKWIGYHGPWFTDVETNVLRRALALQPDDVLVDLGSGTGRMSCALAPFCRRVFALDRSSPSLALLEKRARALGIENVTTVEADLTQPLRANIQATKVIAVELLEPVPSASGRQAVVDNAARVLRPGGRLALLVETHGLLHRARGKPQEKREPGSLFVHTFTRRELIDLVRTAGLTPLRLLGCGVLYWTRYRAAGKALSRIDAAMASWPGAFLVSKFGAMVAAKHETRGM